MDESKYDEDGVRKKTPMVGYNDEDFDRQVKGAIKKEFSAAVASSKDPEAAKEVYSRNREDRKNSDSGLFKSGAFDRVREAQKNKDDIKKLPFKRSPKYSSKR